MKFDYKYYMSNPLKLIIRLFRNNVFRLIGDSLYLKLLWKANFHTKLNLDSPSTFNEKIQYLKLKNRDPRYTKMVDKYETKKYVAGIIGEGHIIPTYGIWNSFDEIDFDSLPDKFVLKCTHDSGGLAICRDKDTFDYKAARTKINKSVRRDYYWLSREWPYKNVPHRIIAEKYMEETYGENELVGLVDYKFFCFDRVPKFLYISKGLENHKTARISFFDLKGELLPFYRSDYKQMSEVSLPSNYDEMLDIATRLAEDVNAPFVRIDLYSIGGNTFFSEITFSPCGGFLPFQPVEWDERLGEYLNLEK